MSKYSILSIALLALSTNVEGKKPTHLELDNYSFEKFIEDFRPNYLSTEYESRKSIFIAELERVKIHNKKNLSWKEGINKFSALSEKEKRGYNGFSKNSKKAHKSPKNLQFNNLKMKPVSELPQNVDWRNENIVSAVKDQGQCGSCWAFASTAVMESAVAKQSGLLFDLSVQQMAMCAPNPDSCGGTGGCQGSTAELAFDYAANSNGFFEEYQSGYQAYYGQNSACFIPQTTAPVAGIEGYVQLAANNYTELMNAIATVGPIAVSVDAAFGAYESGIYSGCPQENPNIDHAVVAVGYGVENGSKYWLIRNSWSPAWGDKGYIKLARSDNDEEVCGMDITPEDGTACAGDTTPEKVCGTCGVLFDSAFPTGAFAF